MSFTTATNNTVCDARTALCGYLSCHTADPGSTGTSEVTGGSYARKALTWPGASSGSSTASQVTADIPAGTTVAYVGFWSLLSGGTFRGSIQLAAPDVFGSAGTFSYTPTISETSA